MELKIGRTYRAKNPAPAGTGYFNDRQILWMDSLGQTIQYDGPAVAFGRKYPKISREQFVKWVDRDVTDELPPGEWQRWK